MPGLVLFALGVNRFYHGVAHTFCLFKVLALRSFLLKFISCFEKYSIV